MSICLGVKLGPSFAEYCLVDTARPKLPMAFRRIYTPTETIQTSLKAFLKEFSAHTPDKIVVASNHLEKILETKLGGTVAQVVTKGFENWPLLRQNLLKPYFEINPHRTEPLASQDLIFGLNERVNSKGEVIQQVSTDELVALCEKLKTLEVERVCINLLFSNLNSENEKKVSTFFQQNGFEVFLTQNNNNQSTNTKDEILSWRKNVLNASLSGTFKEVKDEFLLAIEGLVPQESLFFLDGDSTLFQYDNSRISSSLFGPAKALTSFYKEQSHILFLGLEKWELLKPQTTHQLWQSPWGPLDGEVPSVLPISIQPTQELINDEFTNFNWSSEAVGFEPGPMNFGRGFRPTIFDILNKSFQIEELNTWMTDSGQKKFLDNISAMKKNTPKMNSSSLESIIQGLTFDIVDRIAIQILLERETPNSPILLTGIFARHLHPLFLQRWKELNWQLCPFAKEVEGLSVAEVGGQL